MHGENKTHLESLQYRPIIGLADACKQEGATVLINVTYYVELCHRYSIIDMGVRRNFPTEGALFWEGEGEFFCGAAK